MKNYHVNEIFFSIQGEGMRAGTANVFVRFAYCNMECRQEAGLKSPGGFDCDTEFESGRIMSAQDILAECLAVAPKCKSVIFTGGEPGLQVDGALIGLFHVEHYYLAIETNGSVLLSQGIDWITVSPKVSEHAIRQLTASEVKYVRGYGQGIPQPTCFAPHKLISPATDGLNIDRKAVAWCVQLVKDNPEWRLSIQMHKSWLVR